ncbi:M56 family metallopeptidase [Armatimonas rosea]|uniref:Beta-lactamase regulating signal transducer with metallopeptidase domain n=1 Tax=Armatimonas rosea TaxID=685828 RepID=A0A7W9W6Y6_ARMRO|nr:M56 family metallopeptidase [Armatimonas rosea]MBB6050656.1 beta-lactamase regulating signal transducer with metallopeptidase domain [Armatimonas rosea]
MLELLVKMTLLLGLALMLVACLPRTQASLRHGVLLTSLLLLPLLPVLQRLPTLIAVPLIVKAPAPTEYAPSDILRAGTDIEKSPVHIERAPVESQQAPVHREKSRLQIESAEVCIGVYSVVVFVLLVRLFCDRMALHILLKQTTSAELVALFPVLLTTRSIVPLACGTLRRRILLPHTALGWEPERLRAVLLHESAHLSRHDPLCQLLAELVRALFWFHPLVWLAVAQLRREAETACDRHVLANGIAPDRYAHYLLEIVKMLKKQPSAPAMARTPRLESRVHSILSYLPTRPTRSATLTLALIGVATVPLLAARPATLPQSEAPVKQALPAIEQVKRREELLAQDQEKMRLDQAKAAAEKKATKLATTNNKAKLADEKALQEKCQRELVALKQRARDLDLQQAEADRQLNKRRVEEDMAQARERQTRNFATEPLDEELEELKLKLRNLDNRLTDKQLELADFLVNFGEDHLRVKAVRNQMEVLTKMINEVRRNRDQIRAKLQEVTHVQRAQQQKLQIDEQEQVLVALRAELESLERAVEEKAKQVQNGLTSVDELNKEQAKLKEMKARYQVAESRLKQLKG